MISLSPAAPTDSRSRLFARLAARNRLVAILRIGIPALGAVVLAGLVLQLFFVGLLPDFAFAKFSIDRNRLVIDAPTYAAMSADGTSYDVVAATAATVPGRSDLIDLTDVLLTVRQTDGGVMTAAAAAAQLQTTDQLVRVEGLTRVANDAGAHGTVIGVLANIAEESMTADGAVDMMFANGTTLQASGMTYSSNGRWRFTDATLMLPSTPGATPSGEGDL